MRYLKDVLSLITSFGGSGLHLLVGNVYRVIVSVLWAQAVACMLTSVESDGKELRKFTIFK